MSQIASLFAKLGFQVDSTGLGEFEKKLENATNTIRRNSSETTRANKSAKASTDAVRESQNKLYKEIKANYTRIRVTRERAERDRARIERALTGSSITDADRRQLQDARGRVQQRLDDLIQRERKAQEQISNHQRRITEKRDIDMWQRRSRLSQENAAQERARQRTLAREHQKQRDLMEKRDYEAWKARSKRSFEESSRERAMQREKAAQRRLMEKRDYEAWRLRSERLRQEQAAERRAHQERLRNERAYGRVRRSNAMTYKGAREYGRAWIPGIGGAFAAQRSTKSYQEYVAMEQSLAAATGSIEQGRTEMGFLVDLAQRHGVFVGDMGSDYAKFAASTVGTNMTLEEQRGIFEGVSSMIRVLNMSADDAKGTWRALSQMMSNGQIMAQELQLQLGDRMPGAIQAMARAALKAGVIVEEAGKPLTRTMKDAMAQGKLIAEDLLPHFGRELFALAQQGGALEFAMNSTSAAIGRFRTNVWLANKTFNEAGYDRTVRAIFNTASEAILKAAPAWELLGNLSEHIGRALRTPIELFGELAQKLGTFTTEGWKASTELKLMVASVIAAFRPLRKLFIALFIIPAAIAAITDTMQNGVGEWDDFFAKMAIWALAAAALYKPLRGIGRAMGSIGRMAGPGGSAASAGGSLRMALLASTVLRVSVVGIAATVLASLVKAAIGGDPDKSFSENLRDFGDDAVRRNSEWRDNPDFRSSIGEAWERFKARDRARRAPHTDEVTEEMANNAGLLNDSNIGNYVGLLNDNTLQDYIRSLGQLDDKNIDSYFARSIHGRMIAKPQETRQFIGDVTINVESPDPQEAGFRVEQVFLNLFDRELRLSSMSDPLTER